MSKTVTIKGFAYELRWGCSDNPEYAMFGSDGVSDKYYTLIGPAEFEYTIPDSFNPVAAQVARIDAELVKAREEFAAKVRELNEQKNNLLALEMVK